MLCAAVALAVAMPLLFGTHTAQAAITSVTQNSVPGLDAIPPQVEAEPLQEESFAFVDRNHELTSARHDPASGLLTTAATGTLVGFPSYLLGLQYVANANDNRAAGTSPTQSDYEVTYTLDVASIVYLLMDNRLDGAASNVGSPNTTDPVLEGNLRWVIDDGWQRVNTAIMPNGQADYIGIDEGGSVSGPAARNHHDPGAGVSLNQFYSIYSRVIPAGTFVTRGIRMSSGSCNMYVVAALPAAPPNPPEQVTALNLDGAVQLRWSESGSADSYNVKRSDSAGGPYALLANTEELSYLDNTVVNGNTYYYVVSAVGAVGESDNSAEVIGQPNVAPTNLSALGGANQVALSWTALGGASSYIVRRSETSGGPYATVASGISGTTYTDTGLADGWNYFYVVAAALEAGGESGNSAEAEGITSPSVPGNATAILFAANVIRVSWILPDRVPAEVELETSTDGGVNWMPLTLLPPGQTTFFAEGVPANTTQSYRVRAVNASGESAYAETGAVTTPTFGVDINFANSTFVETIPGYVQDNGLPYTNQNALVYGWDDDNTQHARFRNSANSPDERYDTFNHMQKTDPLPAARSWSIEMPNGFYLVHLVGGDPDNVDSVFQYDVEGLLTPSYTPTTAGRWIDYEATVSVSDGLLTIGNGPDAANNKLSFVNIHTTVPVPNTIGDQPQDLTIVENREATFSISVTGGSQPYTIQWYLDDAPIAGAAGTTHSIPLVQMGDAGVYYAVVSNAGHSVTSQVATLTVEVDNDGPVLLSATRDALQTTVTVVFDERLDQSTAEDPFNYYLKNLTEGIEELRNFNSASLQPDGKTVVLTTGEAITNGAVYRLVAEGIPDLKLNAIDAQEVSLTLVPAFGVSGPNNLVVMEAENADAVVNRVWETVERTWEFTTGRAGYSGTGSMRAMPQTEGNRPAGNEAASLDFYVNFPDAGTYYLWVRGAGENGADNSCHAGLDGVVPATATTITAGFDLGASGWFWNGAADGTIRTTLDVPTPGVHVLQIYMREDGFYCDKILVTQDVGYDPTNINGGLGPPQSPKETAGIELSIRPMGTNIELAWPDSYLLFESVDLINWNEVVGATSPWTIVPDQGGRKFYQLQVVP